MVCKFNELKTVLLLTDFIPLCFFSDIYRLNTWLPDKNQLVT